jgi:uroporphyrinogen-III synthase
MRITAYENRPPVDETVELPAALTEARLDCILFASPSSARNFLDVVGQERGLAWLQNLDIAVIGPTTAAAVQELGLSVAVQPDNSSVPALVAALTEHYGGR